MGVQDVLELVIRIGLVATRVVMRAAEVVLESVFLALAWIALLSVGAVMACQRGGVRGAASSDPRVRSRSPDT